MKEFKHIIFDLDGTIIDSKSEIIFTYTKLLEQIPTEHHLDLNSIDFGANLNDVLNYIYKADNSKKRQAKELFAQLYDNSSFEKTLVYENVYQTLDILKQKNFFLYIATNKRYIPSKNILKAKNLEHYFTDVMANELEPNVTLLKTDMIKYLMDKYGFKNGIMIGDTVGDIKAGKENGLTTIAVSYGYQTLFELEQIKPTYIANSFENLIKFVF